MVHITHSAPIITWPRRVFAGIGSALFGLGHALVINRQSNQRLREIERLQAMTDGDLANMGLSRERIVHHVFRDIYYV